VPLAWGATSDLASRINPQDPVPYDDPRGRQTVELRSLDGSALPHLLLAGPTTAVDWGLTDAARR